MMADNIRRVLDALAPSKREKGAVRYLQESAVGAVSGPRAHYSYTLVYPPPTNSVHVHVHDNGANTTPRSQSTASTEPAKHRWVRGCSPEDWTRVGHVLVLPEHRPEKPHETSPRIEAVLRGIAESGPSTVLLVAPMGSGKTRATLQVLADRDNPSLVVAPSRMLVEQSYGFLASYGYVHYGATGAKEARKVVGTYHSRRKLNPKPLDVVIDEASAVLRTAASNIVHEPVAALQDLQRDLTESDLGIALGADLTPHEAQILLAQTPADRPVFVVLVPAAPTGRTVTIVPPSAARRRIIDTATAEGNTLAMATTKREAEKLVRASGHPHPFLAHGRTDNKKAFSEPNAIFDETDFAVFTHAAGEGCNITREIASLTALWDFRDVPARVAVQMLGRARNLPSGEIVVGIPAWRPSEQKIEDPLVLASDIASKARESKRLGGEAVFDRTEEVWTLRDKSYLALRVLVEAKAASEWNNPREHFIDALTQRGYTVQIDETPADTPETEGVSRQLRAEELEHYLNAAAIDTRAARKITLDGAFTVENLASVAMNETRTFFGATFEAEKIVDLASRRKLCRSGEHRPGRYVGGVELSRSEFERDMNGKLRAAVRRYVALTRPDLAPILDLPTKGRKHHRLDPRSGVYEQQAAFVSGLLEHLGVTPGEPAELTDETAEAYRAYCNEHAERYAVVFGSNPPTNRPRASMLALLRKYGAQITTRQTGPRGSRTRTNAVTWIREELTGPLIERLEKRAEILEMSAKVLPLRNETDTARAKKR